MERQRLEKDEKYQANRGALLCQNLYKTVFLSKLYLKWKVLYRFWHKKAWYFLSLSNLYLSIFEQSTLDNK